MNIFYKFIFVLSFGINCSAMNLHNANSQTRSHEEFFTEIDDLFEGFDRGQIEKVGLLLKKYCRGNIFLSKNTIKQCIVNNSIDFNIETDSNDRDDYTFLRRALDVHGDNCSENDDTFKPFNAFSFIQRLVAYRIKLIQIYCLDPWSTWGDILVDAFVDYNERVETMQTILHNVTIYQGVALRNNNAVYNLYKKEKK